MNIIVHELKSGWKAFFFWSVGVALLVVASMVKYEGVQGSQGAQIQELMDKFPKLILAMFGMVDLDITKVSDYYAVIAYLVLLCVVIYALNLGTGVITNEISDKTSGFLYTKPKERVEILESKLVAQTVFLLGLCVVGAVSAAASIPLIQAQPITALILRYTFMIFWIGFIFLMLGVMIAAIMQKPEHAKSAANILFVAVFILSTLSDSDPKYAPLRWGAPLKYFSARDILDLRIELPFLLLALALPFLFGTLAFALHERKDLIE